MSLAAWIAVASAAVLGEIVYTHRRLARAIVRPSAGPRRLSSYPSVTIVRPVRGRDVEAEENLRAALDTGYPGEVETLFVFDSPDDPAFPLAQRLVDEHRRASRPGRASVHLAGEPPPGRTGKLHAMIMGERLARGELIAFGDSDTRPDRDVLRILVETVLTAPRAGAAFAPVVVAGRPRRAGDVGYALLIDAWYGPAVTLAAARRGDLPFIMGQLMVLTRGALRAIGGVACAEGELVDDMHIGRRVEAAGLRNVMSEHPLHIQTGGMSLGGFMRLFRRWLVFSRGGLPVGFTWPLWLRGVEFWALVALAGFAVARGAPALALLPLGVSAVFGASLLALARRFGAAPVPLRWAWLSLLIPVLAPWVILSTLLHRRVEWRGRPYAIDPAARLA